MMTQKPIDQKEQETSLNRMENTLNDIETIWLEGGKVRKLIENSALSYNSLENH